MEDGEKKIIETMQEAEINSSRWTKTEIIICFTIFVIIVSLFMGWIK